MMHKISLLFLLIFHTSFAQINANKNLNSLLKSYKELPLNGKGISKEEQNYSASLLTFKGEAIPELLKMLSDDELEIRERASYTLRDIDGLNESHLDALIKAFDRGQTWHAVGIASIGNEKAIAALIKELSTINSCHNQIIYSFKKLGEKGLSALIDLLRCKDSCEKIPYKFIPCVFDNLGEKAVSKISELSEIAFSKNYSVQSRQCAIRCLGYIQQNNSKLETNLKNLAYADSINFYDCTFNTLIKIKSNYALDKFNNDLKITKDKSKRIILLRDIAHFGIKAAATGENIIPYLKSNDWDVRVASINTLGYINYTPALKFIENALISENDIRLNYVAINSLALMKAKHFIPLLREISLNHWYPIIRKTAKETINSLENDNSIKAKNQGRKFYREYFSYQNIGENVKFKNNFNFGNPRSIEIESGILIGTDHGEFGGKLIYKTKGKQNEVILKKNICSIHKINEDIIIITKMAHMFTNTGAVYLLKKNSFIPQKIIQLPGAALGSKKIENRILIMTYKGIVELSADLKLRLIE